jgi:hypothetical protein
LWVIKKEDGCRIKNHNPINKLKPPDQNTTNHRTRFLSEFLYFKVQSNAGKKEKVIGSVGFSKSPYYPLSSKPTIEIEKRGMESL